jgi:hypothetical protein
VVAGSTFIDGASRVSEEASIAERWALRPCQGSAVLGQETRLLARHSGILDWNATQKSNARKRGRCLQTDIRELDCVPPGRRCGMKFRCDPLTTPASGSQLPQCLNSGELS